MQELVIGPKTVLVMSFGRTMSEDEVKDEIGRICRTFARAGIEMVAERIISVGPNVNLSTIEPVGQDVSVDDILDDLMETVGRSSDSITDPQGATLLDDRPVPLYDKETTWSYVRGAEQKMQELQAEIDRWKMVAEGGHALPTTDHLLDDVANLMEDEFAAQTDRVRIKFETAAKRCRERAAMLRSHLEAPKQG